LLLDLSEKHTTKKHELKTMHTKALNQSMTEISTDLPRVWRIITTTVNMCTDEVQQQASCRHGVVVGNACGLQIEFVGPQPFG